MKEGRVIDTSKLRDKAAVFATGYDEMTQRYSYPVPGTGFPVPEPGTENWKPGRRIR